MTDELLPCPFCGREAVIMQHEKGEWYTYCADLNVCGTEGWWCKTREEAAGLWNRRAQPASANAAGAGQREALAEYAHEAWSGWMKYMFEKMTEGSTDGRVDGTFIMPEWAVLRWSRQMNTSYADLSQEEKESDRFEADRMLAICRLTASPQPPAQEWERVPDGYQLDGQISIDEDWLYVHSSELEGYAGVELPDGWQLWRPRTQEQLNENT